MDNKLKWLHVVAPRGNHELVGLGRNLMDPGPRSFARGCGDFQANDNTSKVRLSPKDPHAGARYWLRGRTAIIDAEELGLKW
jgi:hypothetical protein